MEMDAILPDRVDFLKVNHQISCSDETNKNGIIFQITTVGKNVLNIFGSILITLYLISSSFCILREDVSRSYLISALLIGAGICTLILALCSVRFAVTGSNRLGYLVCLLMLFETKHCQGNGDLYAMGPELRTAEWRHRLNELQGAVIIICVIQLLIGLLDIRFLARLIRPVSIAPTMILIGLFVIKTSAMRMANKNWTLFTITMSVTFALYFIANNCSNTYDGKKHANLQIRDKLYLGVICVIIMWSLCAVLSTFELIWMHSAARTDVFTGIYDYAAKLRISFPFQWGIPKWRSESTFLMLPAAFITIFEIFANFHKYKRVETAKVANGLLNASMLIKLEAILCLVMNSMGVVIGLNVNVRKNSRKMLDICSAAILITMAISGSLCAFFTTIPEPIVAALIFLIFFSAILEGFDLLRFVNLKSARNVYILGISFLVAFLIPATIREDLEITKTPAIDKILRCLLSTEFVVVGFTAVILDNLFNSFSEEPKAFECRKKRVKEKNEEIQDIHENPDLCDCFSPFFA